MTLSNKARFCFQLTVASLLGLLILFAIRFWVLLPLDNSTTVVLIHWFPLVAFLPGILKRRPRVFIWLCFVILLYFCQGVVDAFALPQTLGILGIAEALLATCLFCASMMAGRYYAQLEIN